MSNATWNLSYADDPTDWDSDHAYLKALDSSLRCALCYDIYTAPVAIKDCAHTFCSACIRRAINKPGEEMGSRCPTCMSKNVYDSGLMPQPTLEAAAQSWRTARPKLYEEQSKVQALQRRLAEQAASASTSANGAKEDGPVLKRAKVDASPLHGAAIASSSSPPRRRSARAEALRSKGNGHGTRITPIIDESENSDFNDDDDNDGGGADGTLALAPAKASSEAKDYRQMQANDLADCPLCGHSFTLVALNRHLDKGTCSPDDPEPSPQERGLPATSKDVNAASNRPGWFQKSSPSVDSAAPSSSSHHTGLSPAVPRRKLVRPNYDMVKLPDLKRLLEEHRLSASGDRKRLMERHRMWTNLYNANLDASEKMRKSDRDLRRELETWERAQDHAATHGGVSEKRAKTWTADHADDFKRLAQQARASHMRDRQKHKDEQAKVAGQADAQETDKSSTNGATSPRRHNGGVLLDRQPSSSPPVVVEP